MNEFMYEINCVIKFPKSVYGLKILFELQPDPFYNFKKCLNIKNLPFYQVGLNQKEHRLENGGLIKVM